MQLDGVLEPVSELYFPSGQFVQLDEPELRAYVPKGQAMQFEAPSNEKNPCAHEEQLDDPVDA
jgi:hypothetical protein